MTIQGPEQLALELEAEFGIQLWADHDPDTLNGYLECEAGKTTVHIYVEDRDPLRDGMPRLRGRTLTPQEEIRLQQVVASHVPSPSAYQGIMSRPVTYYTPSIGRILVWDNRDSKDKAATGFLFLNRDLVLTAAHVVDPAHITINGIEFGSHNIGCTILYRDPLKDIALLRLERKVQGLPIRIRLAIKMPQGMQCIVLGFPETPGFHPAMSSHEVRVVAQRAGYVEKQVLLELSAHLGSGMSGSPVLNERLGLMGMIAGFPSGEESNAWPQWPIYAIPSDEIGAFCKAKGISMC